MELDSKYCVYVHRDLKTGQPFYVGSGRKTRAIEKSQRNSSWKAFVKTNGFLSQILKDGLTKMESLELEYLIWEEYNKKYRLLNQKAPYSLKSFPVTTLRTNLNYDETSPTCLTWKTEFYNPRNGRGHGIGDIAGNETKTKRKVTVDGVSHAVHKVIWLLHNDNILPGYVIDHIDGDYLNNKITNLRMITQAENSRNKRSCGRNKDGVTGVILFKRQGRMDQWRAQYRNLIGECFQKYFSILKLGKEEAFRLAVEWRKEQIRLLNAQGAGYTDRHGT